MTPFDWDSSIAVTFQYRVKESDNNYRVLMAPVEASKANPISTILPPIEQEQALYVDVIDSLGNYVTIRQPIISQRDLAMTATQFAIRVNGIIQLVNSDFNEVDFEQKIYRLRQYFNAYMLD